MLVSGCFLLRSVSSTFRVDEFPCFPGIPKPLNFPVGVYTCNLSVLLNLITSCRFTDPRCQIGPAITLPRVRAGRPVTCGWCCGLGWVEGAHQGPLWARAAQRLPRLLRHTALGPWYQGRSVAVPVLNQGHIKRA